MKTMWSVELKESFYSDDIFNGTYEECIEYCEKNRYEIGDDARLANILVDDDGCVVECIDIIEEI